MGRGGGGGGRGGGGDGGSVMPTEFTDAQARQFATNVIVRQSGTGTTEQRAQSATDLVRGLSDADLLGMRSAQLEFDIASRVRPSQAGFPTTVSLLQQEIRRRRLR